MDEVLSIVGWVLLGAFLGGAGALGRRLQQRRVARRNPKPVADLIRSHLHPVHVDDVTISERRFPFRVRADIQRAMDRLFADTAVVRHFCGIRKEYSHEEINLTACLVTSTHSPVLAVPPQYEDVDTGDAEPIRCLKNGLWLLQDGETKYVVLWAPLGHFGRTEGLQFQIATPNSPAGTKLAQDFFGHLEESVLKAESYRGKILSLEQSEHSYSGQSTGIRVHTLRTVERDQVILPQKTLDLLDRNLLQFVRQRPRLAGLRLATKKGILFYGPPGTGKTHTIHYLSKALSGHTTLIVTAEQVGLLGEYMTLARLLQPSIVVIEDVDLIASDREDLGTCEEVLLNKLLNEMDGLTEEADILFILTTNRPEALERALASRPGRIDQAIEFPLPDADGREKLVRLYARGAEVAGHLVSAIVQRTEGVSAAFIKELMRRSVQFQLERDGSGAVQLEDVENALEEMLFSGGALNLKLLGAEGAGSSSFMRNCGTVQTGHAGA